MDGKQRKHLKMNESESEARKLAAAAAAAAFVADKCFWLASVQVKCVFFFSSGHVFSQWEARSQPAPPPALTNRIATLKIIHSRSWSIDAISSDDGNPWIHHSSKSSSPSSSSSAAALDDHIRQHPRIPLSTTLPIFSQASSFNTQIVPLIPPNSQLIELPAMLCTLIADSLADLN